LFGTKEGNLLEKKGYRKKVFPSFGFIINKVGKKLFHRSHVKKQSSLYPLQIGEKVNVKKKIGEKDHIKQIFVEKTQSPKLFLGEKNPKPFYIIYIN